MSRAKVARRLHPVQTQVKTRLRLTLGGSAPILPPSWIRPPRGTLNASHAEVVVPRIKSAKKRMRQTRAHTLHNRTQRSQLRTAIKRVRSAGTAADAEKAYAEAVKIIDRAGRKNLIHRNAADRQKSRLAKAVKAKG